MNPLINREPWPFVTHRTQAEIMRAERANRVVTRAATPGAAPGGPANKGPSQSRGTGRRKPGHEEDAQGFRPGIFSQFRRSGSAAPSPERGAAGVLPPGTPAFKFTGMT